MNHVNLSKAVTIKGALICNDHDKKEIHSSYMFLASSNPFFGYQQSQISFGILGLILGSSYDEHSIENIDIM